MRDDEQSRARLTLHLSQVVSTLGAAMEEFKESINDPDIAGYHFIEYRAGKRKTLRQLQKMQDDAQVILDTYSSEED